MKNEIKIMLKPDWVSWDAVQECQRNGHEKNRQKGIDMNCVHLTGEELKRIIGTGYCFVAMDGEKVVGTCSYNRNKTNHWWCKGNMVYLCMEAVLPEYQGLKIYSRLCEARKRHIRENGGADMLWLSTAEQNKNVQRMHEIDGFYKVQLSYTSVGSTYYSVVMAKWARRPLPSFVVRLMYWASYIVVKTIWKPGGIKRLQI